MTYDLEFNRKQSLCSTCADASFLSSHSSSQPDKPPSNSDRTALICICSVLGGLVLIFVAFLLIRRFRERRRLRYLIGNPLISRPILPVVNRQPASPVLSHHSGSPTRTTGPAAPSPEPGTTSPLNEENLVALTGCPVNHVVESGVTDDAPSVGGVLEEEIQMDDMAERSTVAWSAAGYRQV